MKAIGERSFAHRRRAGAAAACAHREALSVQEPGGTDRALAGGAGARQGAHPRLVRPAAEGRRRDRALSEVPREERAERIQPAGRGRQPSRRCSSSTPTRPRRRAASKRSRRRSTRPFPGHHLQGAIALERKEHPSDRPLSRELGLSGRLGALRRTARRRDEAVLGRSRSARHAVEPGAARGAAGRRLRHPHAWAGRGSRRSTSCSRTPPRIPPTSRPRSIATSSIRDRRPPTCSASWRSARRATRRSRRWGEVRHQAASTIACSRTARSRSASCTRRSAPGRVAVRRRWMAAVRAGAGDRRGADRRRPSARRRRRPPAPRSTCRRRRSPSCRRR